MSTSYFRVFWLSLYNCCTWIRSGSALRLFHFSDQSSLFRCSLQLFALFILLTRVKIKMEYSFNYMFCNVHKLTLFTFFPQPALHCNNTCTAVLKLVLNWWKALKHSSILKVAASSQKNSARLVCILVRSDIASCRHSTSFSEY